MGHLFIGHAVQLMDVLRLKAMFLRSFIIYSAVMVLISSFLTVIETYNGFQGAEILTQGSGGLFGIAIGGLLAKNFGLVGALVILITIVSVMGIAAGFMELVHSFYVMKEIFVEILQKLMFVVPKFLKVWDTI